MVSFLENCYFAEDSPETSWHERHFQRVWRRHSIMQRAVSTGYAHSVCIVWNNILLHCDDVEDHRPCFLVRLPWFLAFTVPLWIGHYPCSPILCSSLCTTLFAVIPCMIVNTTLTSRGPCQKDKSVALSWSCPSLLMVWRSRKGIVMLMEAFLLSHPAVFFILGIVELLYGIAILLRVGACFFCYE